MTATATPTPKDPNFAARIREAFDLQGFMQHIGASLTLVEAGRVQITLPYAEHVTQHHGFFNGGATIAMADSAGGYACQTLTPAGTQMLTVELKVNLLAPATGDKLVATGHALRVGRTLAVCDMDVHAWTGDTAKLVAKGLGTMYPVSDIPIRDL